MKEKIIKAFYAVAGAVSDSKWGQRAGVAGIVVAAILAAVAALGLLVALVLGLIFISVLLPGLAVGFLSWLTWTYFGLGATYFPSLDPMYQSIPFLHFAFGWATIIFASRVLRKGSYGKIDRKVTEKKVAIGK